MTPPDDPVAPGPAPAADAPVVLATSPRVAGVGGRYLEDRAEAEVVAELRVLSGVLPHGLDPAAARRLWTVSQELLDAART